MHKNNFNANNEGKFDIQELKGTTNKTTNVVKGWMDSDVLKKIK